MAGKKGRRGWGKIRQLPSSKRFQASYVGPDLVRHNAPVTYAARMDAEGWLSNERRLIEFDTWTPPSQRTAERHAKSVSLGEYGAQWLEQRTTRGGEPLKPTSKAHYQKLLTDHIKPLSKIPLKNLTPPAVRTWYAAHTPRQAGDAGTRLRLTARDPGHRRHRRVDPGESMPDRAGDEGRAQAPTCSPRRG